MYAHFFGKEPIYLKLFDALLSQPLVNDVRVRKGLNLSVSEYRKQKQYLLENLLKSFQFFGKREDQQLSQLIMHIRELIRRRVFGEASLKIGKAKRIALSYEWFREGLILNDLERSLPSSFRKSTDLEAEKAQFQSRIDNLEVLATIRTQLEGGIKQWNSPEPGISLPASVVKRAHVKDPGLALSHRARLEQLIIQRICQVYLENYDLAAVYAEKALSLMEEAPFLVAHQGMETYLNESNIIARLCFVNRDTHKFHNSLFKLRNYPVPQYLQSFQQELVLSTLFAYSLETGNVAIALTDLSKLEETLDQWSDEMDPRKQVRFLYQGAQLYWVYGDHSKALRLLNQCLHLPENKEARINYQGYARILHLILLWETGDYDWLEHAAQAALRYWKKQGANGKYPQVAIKTIARAPALTDQQPAYFSAKWKQCKSLRNENPANWIENDLRLLLWLESKVRKVSLTQILEEHYQSEETSGTKTQTG